MAKIRTILRHLELIKSLHDIRGKKFMRGFGKIERLFSSWFHNQAIALCERLAERQDLLWPQIIKKSSWWEDILDIFGYDEAFEMKLSEILNEVYDAGISDQFRESVAEVKGSFSLENIHSANYAATRAWELMRWVTETTKKEVRALFAESWHSGDSLEIISEKIHNTFSGFSRYRASLIAQQETSFAYETGRADQFALLEKNMWVVGWKRSQSQGDSAVRPTHRQNELDGWIPNDQTFSGTDTMMAPDGFRCRCVTSRRLLEPTEQEKQYQKVRPFQDDLEVIASMHHISLDGVKRGKNEYINLLNTLSVVNAHIPGKRDGKSNPAKKAIYDIKYAIIENIIERMRNNEIKGKYFLNFDTEVHMPTVLFDFWWIKKSFHVNQKTYQKLLTKK